MLGTIIGDIVGSVYENTNATTDKFPMFTDDSRFTDDSVMTIATADALLHVDKTKFRLMPGIYFSKQYALSYKTYGNLYPDCGFGKMFKAWLQSEKLSKQDSFGNGAAMRVSPIGFSGTSLESVLKQAKYSTQYSHNHPQSVKGACAVAMAVFMSKNSDSKEQIKLAIESKFGYNLNTPLSEIKADYEFDSTCAGSVPQAIRVFLEGQNYEDTIRKAIFLGGDSDTIAAISGGIAEAYYKGIPKEFREFAMDKLDDTLKEVVLNFYHTYNIKL